MSLKKILTIGCLLHSSSLRLLLVLSFSFNISMACEYRIDDPEKLRFDSISHNVRATARRYEIELGLGEIRGILRLYLHDPLYMHKHDQIIEGMVYSTLLRQKDRELHSKV